MGIDTDRILDDHGMPRSSWIAELPAASTAVDRFPDCELDAIELRDLAIAAASVSLVDVVDRPELVNVRLVDIDLAGLVARGGRADRVLVDGGRLRGVTWANGLLRDIELRGVTTSDLSFRFSTLRRAVFRDCDLAGIDLTEANLDEVRFTRCRMSAAQFHRAQAKSLRIEGCDLAGAAGVEALGGASVHPDDLVGLAPSMALALGLKVEIGDE